MVYETPPLQIIAEALADENYASEYLPANDNRPIDMLLVSLTGENSSEPVILELTFTNDLLLKAGVEENIDDAMILQFLVRYRFSFAKESAAELALLLMALNRVLPVGAFGLSEDVGTVYLQYALFLPSRMVDQDVLGTIVAGIDSLATDLIEPIQAVGGGQRNAQEALQQLQEQGLIIPPMLPGPASLIEPEENTA